jgi:hypothetical protein
MAEAFVQANTLTTGGSQTTSLAGAYSSNNTLNNFLLLIFRSFTTTTSFATWVPTDTQGNIWYAVPGNFNNGSLSNLAAFYVPRCKAGANTVTVNPAYTGFIRVILSEYSGVLPFTFQNHAHQTATSISSGNITTLSAGSVFGFMGNDTNGALSPTISGAWNSRANVDGCFLVDQLNQAPATFSLSATYASSVSIYTEIMSFNDTNSGVSKPLIYC